MILNAQELFSNDQAITATALSTNVIDLGLPQTPYGGKKAVNRDIGKGTPIPILIQVTSDFATLTSLAITIEVSANVDMSSSVVLSSQTIAVAALKKGKKTSVQVVPNDADRRYMAIRYTVAGSNATAGTITAGISMGNQTNITG
jgi:hypothetical protein